MAVFRVEKSQISLQRLKCQHRRLLLCVEVPNDFTDLQIDNLAAMAAAKELLLKKVLDAKRLPIRGTEDKIAFNWFTLSDPADATYYLQFIYALCETAKEKKRITATKPDF